MGWGQERQCEPTLRVVQPGPRGQLALPFKVNGTSGNFLLICRGARSQVFCMEWGRRLRQGLQAWLEHRDLSPFSLPTPTPPRRASSRNLKLHSGSH